MNQEKIMHILLEPLVTEKSTFVGEKNNQFLFKVHNDASKTEIKKAVESLFGVKVLSVQVINVKGKIKMFKNRYGSRKGFKKSYVRLAPGNDINFSNI